MGIVIAKVISLPNVAGEEVMVEYLQCLGEEASVSLPSNIKLHFLQKAFSFMEAVPLNKLPDRSNQPLIGEFTIEIGEEEYNLEMELVKSLNKAPIYELRIDLHRPHWCFRATFFPKFSNQQLHYCFVYPFEKVAGYDDPTNGYRDKTYDVLEDLRSSDFKYAHYFL